ncbi:putative bric-a-brac [Operophtera brumata]|uniref:Putative bric-a-brac n=1 Tax=Operophtera brumata TaxID=104452 RepID=A0A0L7LPI5_OPEBR|nr:putative bric-a-brac [Operophtera brumata]
MEEASHAARVERAVSTQTEQDQVVHPASSTTIEPKREIVEEERPKKRVSILSPEDEKLRVKKKPMTVRFQEDVKGEERSKLTSPGPSPVVKSDRDRESQPAGIKVVQLAALQKQTDDYEDSDERKLVMDEDEETDSSGSISDSAANEHQEGRPHVCEVCDLRFQRSSHLNRHRLTHTGERPFTCGGCGRSFARSDKLREDPTVDMANETSIKREYNSNSEVMSGMVRTTHRESGHLVT